MEFPNLKDTKFPNVGNVNVYSYRNDFDYTRWTPSTRLKLCNVLWNGDYEDVVKFESDAARDSFFDNLPSDPDCVTVLNTNIRMDRNTVKVPIPFDKACRFNYLVVDVPVATSPDNMLKHEVLDGVRRWHFFVTDWANNSPSTTTLTLALDVWTQFINSVGINYMLLERGHAPVAATNVDSYLENPIENSGLLLAADVDFGGETISEGGKFIPFGNGKKYLCMASTCAPSQLINVGTVTETGDMFTDPTFSDAQGYPDNTNRWGRQYQVNGYAFGNGRDYSNATTPASNNVTANGRVPSATSMYCVPMEDAETFLADALKTAPSFMNTLVGCFMLAEEFIKRGTAHTLAGHRIYECIGSENAAIDVKLDKSMFSFPERYAHFAKLYTFPYSQLEITDNNGKSVGVRVESTGNMKAHAITALAYPFMDMRLWFSGIGGKGSSSYEWRDLSGTNTLEMGFDDWARFCFDMEIPLYALYMDGNNAWNLGNYNRSIANARNSALTNYHNSVREANNAYANAVALANTAQTNADNSADANKTCADNTASTNKTNTNNEANTLSSNHANSRAMATDVTANNNACAKANVDQDNALDTSRVSTNNSLSSAANSLANSVAQNTTREENAVSVASATNNRTAAILGASLTVLGVATGGIATAVAAGALAASGANVISAGYNLANSQAMSQTSSAVTDLQTHANDTNTTNTNSTNTSLNTLQMGHNIAVTNNSCDNATSNTARSNACDSANTANTVGTMRTNAANTAAMISGNATTLRDTTKANAANTRNTTVNNAGYTDSAAIVAAQDILRNTQNLAKATNNDMRNAKPVQVCAPSGDYTPDYMRTRGVQIKVRKEPESSIAQAGDVFTRYGYALNRIWPVDESGLCLMKHFTYWKASECWVYDKCESNDSTQLAISDIFKKGTTVWSNPMEIGKVNPYDNRR